MNKITPKIFCIHGRKTPISVPVVGRVVVGNQSCHCAIPPGIGNRREGWWSFIGWLSWSYYTTGRNPFPVLCQIPFTGENNVVVSPIRLGVCAVRGRERERERKNQCEILHQYKKNMRRYIHCCYCFREMPVAQNIDLNLAFVCIWKPRQRVES